MSKQNLDLSIGLEDLSRLSRKKEAEVLAELFETAEGEDQPTLREDVNVVEWLLDASKSNYQKEKEYRTSQYKRGVKEVADKFDDYFRSLGEFDDELQGLDLAKAVLEAQKSAGKEPGEKVDVEKLLDERLAPIRKKYEEDLQAERDNFSKLQSKIHRSEVKAHFQAWLNQNNYQVTGENDVVAQKWADFDKLFPFDQVVKNGSDYNYMEGDETKRDDYGAPSSIEDLYKVRAAIMGVHNKVKPKDSSPSPDPNGSGNKGPVPKTTDELKEHLKKAQELKLNGKVKEGMQLEKAARSNFAEYSRNPEG